MPKSNEEMKEWNKQAYGFEVMYGYKEQVLDAHKWDSPLNAYMSGAASVLSDAQHMLEFDDVEGARQAINVAKALIFSTRIEDRGKTPSEYAAAVKVLTDLPEL